MITLIICYILARRYIKNLNKLIEEDDGLSEKTHKFNKYMLMNKLKDTFSIKKKKPDVILAPMVNNPGKPEKNNPRKIEEELVRFQEITDEKLEKLQENTEEKLVTFQEVIQQDMKDLHSKIDQMLKANGTPIRSK